MKKSSYFRLSQSAVEQLAEHFSTPLLLLSVQQIENNYNFLHSHMPRVKIHYAVKANPDENIIRTVARLGGSFDVASDGEIKDLSALGIAGSRLLYANPFKTDSGLNACKQAGVTRFTFDSASELTKIAQSCPGADVLLRVRIDNSVAVVDLNKKFGAAPQEALSLIRLAASVGLNIVGLCFHVGSQTLSSAPYMRALSCCRDLFDQAKEAGYDLSVLDIGGGYPVPSREEDVNISQMLTEINNKMELLFPDTEIWSEPGRFICATAVNMITKVIGVTERNDQAWYFLDEGVYGTFSGVLFDHWDYDFISFKEGHAIAATFAGPSCDSLDIICCDRMTVPLAMGDLLLIPACGAYSSASATTFNGFSKAQLVVWEEIKEKFKLAEFSYAPAV